MIRILLISGGTLSLLLGIIGIFIPVLPTTPFVLLSAGLFVKSSPALYNKVVTGRLTSRYMTREASRRAGITALAIMWLMIIVTVVFAAGSTWLRILLVAIGLMGTAVKIIFFFGRKGNILQNNSKPNSKTV